MLTNILYGLAVAVSQAPGSDYFFPDFHASTWPYQHWSCHLPEGKVHCEAVLLFML